MAGDVLPFVLEHGAWVSRIALALVVVTPIAVGIAVGRWRARKQVREKVGAMERHADHVRGTLRGGSIVSLHAKAREYANLLPADVGPSEIVATHTTGDVWLDTKEGRVKLEGPLELVAGSVVHVSRKGVPAETPAELFEEAQEKAKWVHRPGEAGTYAIGTATLRILRQGDEIIATGLVESVASKTPDTAGYRDNAASMEIRAVSNESPIRLASRAPIAERTPLRVFPLLFAAVVLFGFGYAVSRSLGATWMKRCSGTYAKNDSFELSNTHACSLAAATWGRERPAKHELLWQLERARPSARTHAQLMALSDEVDNCAGKVARRMKSYDYDGARAHARACNDRRGEHLALLADGKFAEAAAIKVPASEHAPALPSTATLVLAGRWPDAITAVEAEIARFQSTSDENAPANIHYHQCLRELFSFYGGDATALVRLRTLDESNELSSCDPMLYELMTPEERAAQVVTKFDRGDLRWSFGYVDEPRYAAESAESSIVQASEMSSGYSLHLLWLIDTNRDIVLKGPVGNNAHTHRWLAAARIYDGDAAGAFEEAKLAYAAAANASASDEYELRDLPHLRAAIAFRTSTIEPANFVNPPGISAELLELVRDNWGFDFGRLALRSGTPLDQDKFQSYFNSDYRVALNTALEGNGLPLLGELHGYMSSWSPGDLMAVWPYLETGKEALLEALRYSRSSSLNPQLDYYFPFGLVGLAIDYRDAFRIAGATADAEVWNARYQRLDAALSDRKRLIALMMLRGLD